MLDIVQADKKEEFDPDLAIRDPGLLNNSRSLTSANRVLRFYIFQTEHLKEIKILVKYIVAIYAPV